MFQMRSLEMVHWDFWQRLAVPLDAQIVTIIGPNGSGKTTLLDALRTLLAIKCSGKRDYKRYVRNNREAYAYLRGVVDNPRRAEGGLYPTPFFPIVTASVTLLCRIKKQGGDWVRHYAILDGEVALEDVDERAQWLGVHEYRRRLEAAGLTAAVAEVLALEQGDTDKLTEYSPKQLLDLVFQVFGDKAVLDNYQRAREEQQATEAELAQLAQRQEQLELRVEAMRGRANRYLQWQRLSERARAIRDEALPVLAWLKAREGIAGLWRGYRDAVAARGESAARHGDALGLVDKLAAAERAADAARDAADAARVAAQQAFTEVRESLREVEGQLKERDRLRALAGKEYGDDAEALSARLAALRGDVDALKLALHDKKQRREAQSRELALLEGGRSRAPEDVRAFRAALDEAGIAHQPLSDIVEVLDARWQGAVEALLKPSRHVMLLADPAERRRAWELGQRLRYRHFIVAERGEAPRARAGSLLEVVRFSAPAPDWVYQQLQRVSRVDSVADGEAVDGDWITPDGFYRERRGARHIGVAVHDYAFGEAARQAALAAARDALKALNVAILADEEALVAASREAASLADYLSGMDAMRMLDARADEFAALEAQRATLTARAAELGVRLADAQAEAGAAQERYFAERDAHHRVCEREQEAVGLLTSRRSAVAAQRRAVRAAIVELRGGREHLAPERVSPAAIAALLDEYDDFDDAEYQLRRVDEELADGDWETDASVLALRDKLAEDMEQLSRECERRLGEVERARGLTADARDAYLGKLRATVRAYAANVKRLGELAGIAVEVELPRLASDDVELAQAGLTLKFNFDQKGMMGMNDGEASGGQQVMKSLILLIGLMMDESNPSGFVFIDEPFAHLDIFNIDRVAGFLKATEAQYLITTPNTHNVNIFAPSDLTLATRKKRPGEPWAPPILQTRRREGV